MYIIIEMCCTYSSCQDKEMETWFTFVFPAFIWDKFSLWYAYHHIYNIAYFVVITSRDVRTVSEPFALKWYNYCSVWMHTIWNPLLVWFWSIRTCAQPPLKIVGFLSLPNEILRGEFHCLYLSFCFPMKIIRLFFVWVIWKIFGPLQHEKCVCYLLYGKCYNHRAKRYTCIGLNGILRRNIF